MAVVRVSIICAWCVEDYPDLFYVNDEWVAADWLDYDNIFKYALVDDYVLYVSRVRNDDGEYLILKTRLPLFTDVQHDVAYQFDYRAFFRFANVQNWILGFHE